MAEEPKDAFTVLREFDDRMINNALYKLRETYEAELAKERAHSKEVMKFRDRWENSYLNCACRSFFLLCICIIEACTILFLMFAR